MNTKVKNYISKNKYLKHLESFKDILWFLCLFLLFEFIWKVCVHQGENESILLVLGHNLTEYTQGICLWTAKTVYWVVHDILGYNDFQMNGITLMFKGSVLPIDIVWGCTGIKQVIMFSFILALYSGSSKAKLWYIPMSIFILILINIIRLTVIFIIIKNPFPEWFISVNEWYNGRVWENTEGTYVQFYKDWFNVFHRDIFTWIYYDGVIFILWLIWEEKIRKPYDNIIAKKR